MLTRIKRTTAIKTVAIVLIGFVVHSSDPARAQEADPLQTYSRGYPAYTGPRYDVIPTQLPAAGDVFAPVIVAESPNNEANILAMPDGTLRCYYAGKQSTLFLESRDEGITWGDPQLAFVCETADHYPRRMMLDRAGNQHCLFFGSENLDVFHTILRAGESNWSEPQLAARGRNGAIRNLTELANGRFVFAFHRRHGSRTPPTGSSFTTAVYSDDGGKTWTESESQIFAPCHEGFNGNNYGAVEPTVVALRNDRLWMLLRTQDYRQYQSFSDDGGETWSPGSPSPFTSSNSPAHLRRLADGRILILWCNARETDRSVFGQMYTNRTSLSAAISDDDGRTWRGFREIYRDPARDSYAGITRGDSGTSYPNAAQNDSGKVVFCCGQYDGLRAIGLFDPDWLLETTQVCDFSRVEADLERWHLYTFLEHSQKGVRRRGPEIVESDSAIGGHALRFRRIDRHHADAGLWNFPLGRAGRMEITLMAEDGAAPVAIELSDHHRHPNDPTTADDALFRFTVGNGQTVPLSMSRSEKVVLDWNLDRQIGTVSLNGRSVAKLRPQRETPTGACYVRLRSLAVEPNPAAIALERVAVEVTRPLTLPNPQP